MNYGACSSAAKAITENPNTAIHSAEAWRTAVLPVVNKPEIPLTSRNFNFSNDNYSLT